MHAFWPCSDTARNRRVRRVDTPEGKQPFVTRARLFRSELPFGTVAVVVRDTDRYRRLVAVITLPDAAWWFKRYAPGDRKLEEVESETRRARRGLRKNANPVAR